MKKKAEFDLSLDFQPSTAWPASLPAVAIGPYLIAGFSLSPDHPTYMLEPKGSEANTNHLKDLYPHLDLCELARLTSQSAFTELFNEDLLYQLYHLSPNPDLKSLLLKIPHWPQSFQNWISQKRPGYQEIIPLLSHNSEPQKFLIEEIVRNQESKSLSIQRLELLSDLLHMEQAPETLKNLSLEELYRKRYPQTSLRDQNTSSLNLTLPKTVKSRFKRFGDKGGFEFQFFAGTPAELNKTAQQLLKAAQNWNSNLEKNS